MTDQSPILGLPLMQAAQAQKHVTHNEALMQLDLVVQLAVADRVLAVAPPTPMAGDRHIVAAAATGVWAGHDAKVAQWLDGVWQFHSPQPGWRAWIAAESAVATFDGAVWVTPAEAALTVAQLGVSAMADGTNRLAVSSDAVLFNHAGAGHQLKLNKASLGDTASVMFQTGFSGRVEMGTAGDNDFSVKVSTDGSSFATALKVLAATAQVELAKPLVLTGQISDPIAPPNGSVWLNLSTGELKAQIAGRVAVLGGQQEVPWMTPGPGEFVMTTIGGGTAVVNQTGTANRMELFPFLPRAELAIDAMGINCGTAVGGALAKLVLYSSDANGMPDSLIAETAELDLSTTGNKIGLTNQTLLPGRCYWLGLRHSANAVIAAWPSQATPDLNGGTAMVPSARKVLRRSVTFASAAPSVWIFDPAEISTASAPAIWLRMA